jgi:micrococcal nuclease
MTNKFILALLITLFSTLAVAEKTMVIYDFPVTRVIDGDTVAFQAAFLPAPLKQELSIRVYGVDTPEKGFRAKCEKEAALGLAASVYTKKIISAGKKIRIAIMDWDKFGGRVLGDIIIDDKSLRDLLIAGGYARPYFGEAKQSWCD